VFKRKKTRKNYRKGTKKKPQFAFLHRLAVGFYVIAGVAGLIATSFLFILVHDVITQCDYFKAKSLKIEGVQRLSRNQIIEAARVKKGMNVLASLPGFLSEFRNIPRWQLSIWVADTS
jgi:cell division septal protein FtsQ